MDKLSSKDAYPCAHAWFSHQLGWPWNARVSVPHASLSCLWGWCVGQAKVLPHQQWQRSLSSSSLGYARCTVLKPYVLIAFPVAVVSCSVGSAGLSSISEAKLFGATLVAAPQKKKNLTDNWKVFFGFGIFVFFTFVLRFFFVCFCFFPFLSLLPIDKNPVFPLEKGIFCLFLSVSLCFPLAVFGLPVFQFLFLCLSLVLFFLSSFLSLIFVFFCSLSFSLFFPFLSSLLLFHERTTSKYSIATFFFWYIFFFFGFLSCFLFEIPFSYICFLLILSYVFCSTSMFLVKKKNQIEKHKFLVKRWVATKLFFLWTCVLQNVKSYRFFLPIFAMFKKL